MKGVTSHWPGVLGVQLPVTNAKGIDILPTC